VVALLRGLIGRREGMKESDRKEHAKYTASGACPPEWNGRRKERNGKRMRCSGPCSTTFARIGRGTPLGTWSQN